VIKDRVLLLIICAISQLAFATADVSFLSQIRSGLQSPVDVAISPHGNIYILDDKLSRIRVFDAYGEFSFEFSGKGSDQGQVKNPQSIAIGASDRVIIADTGNNRVQVFDLQGKFLFAFGSSGNSPGQFKKPQAVATDAFGLIYVADTFNQRIQYFSPGGVYLGQFKTPDKPTDLTSDAQRNIYALMPAMRKIIKYSPEGKTLNSLSGSFRGKEYLTRAACLTVDDKGDLYFTEQDEHSLKKIDEFDSVLLSFGSEGDGMGQLDQPRGIAVDSKGQIFIADNRNRRVQVFKASGNNKPVLPPASTRPAYVDVSRVINAEKAIIDLDYSESNKTLYALSDKNNHLLVIDTMNKVVGRKGNKSGEFNSPGSVHVDSRGSVYVADSRNNRIQVFSGSGDFEFKFGERGNKTGRFDQPGGVAVNGDAKIVVADTRNNRIELFNTQGIFLDSFGAKSSNSKDAPPPGGTFLAPGDLDIDSQGKLYVLDQLNNRIQVFNERGMFLWELGREGDLVGEFNRPADLSVDSEGFIYVADTGNNRVQIFDNQGYFLLAFGSNSRGPGSFQELSAVSAADNKIYVADYKSSQISVFQFYPRQRVTEKAPVLPHQTPKEQPKEADDEFELM
jgi:tripartite motif-containing protein 71